MPSRRPFAATLLSVGVLVACSVGHAGPAAPAVVRAPSAPAQSPAESPVSLPNGPDSLKFAVLGDFGVGSREQYQLADQMAKLHDTFKFELVTLVGDNLYGSERPQDFQQKFEIPYKRLLDAGVKFYASLGNHDDAHEQRYYKLFNMDGKTYYSFKAPKQNVRFFVLESTYLEPEQIAWLEKELKGSNEDWKIVYFHHPPYSSGERHGSDTRLRQVLEPLFIQYNVSLVFNGHEHFYARMKPQNGIVYFIVGSGGQLRKGNIDKGSPLTAKGFDTDQAFMAAEIQGDEMYFNAISRQGQIVDSGVITRRKPAK
jgi:3',5'-cyclic AMP phosphodiesterase CpdA